MAQVVITSQDTKPTGPEVTTNVVGPAKTVQMCTNQEQPTDPWLTNDPWRTATAAVALPPGPSAANALQEMEDRLEQTLLAKLPTHHDMEVDEQESRLQYLEQQVPAAGQPPRSLRSHRHRPSCSEHSPGAKLATADDGADGHAVQADARYAH